MLEAWHNFKICGPVREDADGLTWVVFGQRHDGAVFWRILSVARHQDFWQRIGFVFEMFDTVHSHATAPAESFASFKDVGVWFENPENKGEWFFK
jgi:hypothetical protein